MERIELITKLKHVPKNTEVYIWDTSTRQYIDTFFIWEEGHDYRHFIDLDYLHSKEHKHLNKRYTVGEFINDLKQTYKRMDQNYANTITVNVNNKKNENTANFDLKYKNGKLYLVGRVPNWKLWSKVVK
ncbi:hypothetical protein [Lysinibacillus sp. BPa_S21]|uniref:hypothetical protein n=1 Tax=Lysinibacillus sp. BPa_S21 TaxID=2932478 RepID=UPI002012AEDE|nr:hypothetical protein [Lysinibacillus sp. BPa_S21]MCL1696349.1 hypothetical protein [Lysinibacillus sp. BPa_S21]